MYKQIKELAEKAGMEDWTDDGNWRGTDDDLIRLGKLMIAEIERIIDDSVTEQIANGATSNVVGMNQSIQLVKKHFGVI